MDAGVPIKRPVAGISCGLISDQETGAWRTFTDIQGVEDFHGEMDFKVAGTTEGVTAIQMDLKNKGLTMEIIADALERCRKARLEILDKVMLPCISEPRADVSEYAPKMISMRSPSRRSVRSSAPAARPSRRSVPTPAPRSTSMTKAMSLLPPSILQPATPPRR